MHLYGNIAGLLCVPDAANLDGGHIGAVEKRLLREGRPKVPEGTDLRERGSPTLPIHLSLETGPGDRPSMG